MVDIRTLHGSLSLGKNVSYLQTYTPSLLCTLPRGDGRAVVQLENNRLPFDGVDIWTAYELSWLDGQGKPMVACGIFYFPCQSPGMIESKSFKMYLNSFNQTQFSSVADVKKTLELDLSLAVQDSITVELYTLAEFAMILPVTINFPGSCIDDISIKVDEYRVNPELLSCDENGMIVEESLHSHLLKTNCPVTGQPDWASILIYYQGRRISRESLLRYLCSYRLENDFHEQCVERIFVDILRRCQCDQLTVEARYMRRGGLDINPFRSSCSKSPLGLRMVRQ